MTNPKPQEIKGFVAVVDGHIRHRSFEKFEVTLKHNYELPWRSKFKPVPPYTILPAILIVPALTLDTEKNDG